MGRTGAVWMTVVCGTVVGGVAWFLGVGAGSGWYMVSADERMIMPWCMTHADQRR